MKVLWISPKLPYPPESGDKLRQFNLIRHLSSSVEISLMAFILDRAEETFTDEMRRYCSRVEPWYSPNFGFIKKVRAVFGSANPYYVIRYFDERLVVQLQQEIARFRPDVIQVEHTYLAQYLRRILSQERFPTVLTKHNVDADLAHQSYLLAGTVQERLFWFMEWHKMKRYEPAADRLFSCVVVMSEPDRRSVMGRDVPPLRVRVVENGVDTRRMTPMAETDAPVLLFVGAFDYLPNQDAADYLCREIFPLIRERMPRARLMLVGRKPPEIIRSLPSDRIEVHADVPDVAPFYQRASVAVVPLRAGSGSRLKILEAMSLGRPVVSTSKGAEGLDLTNGLDILVADDSRLFADSVLRLFEDRALYTRLVTAARLTVEQKYDWSMLAEKMIKIYEEITEDAKTR